MTPPTTSRSKNVEQGGEERGERQDEDDFLPLLDSPSLIVIDGDDGSTQSDACPERMRQKKAESASETSGTGPSKSGRACQVLLVSLVLIALLCTYTAIFSHTGSRHFFSFEERHHDDHAGTMEKHGQDKASLGWYSTEACDLINSKQFNGGSDGDNQTSTTSRFLAEKELYRRDEQTFVPINRLREDTISKRRDDWEKYQNLVSQCTFEDVVEENGSKQEEDERKDQQQRDGERLLWRYLGQKQEDIPIPTEIDSSGGRDDAFDWTEPYNHPKKQCTIPDEDVPNVYWTIERVGPFRSTGGYSNIMHAGHELALPAHAHGRDVHVLGGAIHPVDVARPRSTIYYPPIHIHHAHIYPYDQETAFKRIVIESPHAWTDGHAVMLQAHGDSMCQEEEGGEACLLKLLPEGHGYRVSNFTGTFEVDFNTNDVRDANSEPMEYYVQLAIKWTLAKQKYPTTFMAFQNPIMPNEGIPSTYTFHREDSAVLWFKFTNEHLGNGRLLVDSLILHAHQSMFDSLWLFKGDDVYVALESFREKVSSEKMRGGEEPVSLPLRVTASEKELTDVKHDLIKVLLADIDLSKNELLCEVPSPTLVCQQNHRQSGQDDIRQLLYDRRVQMYCKDGHDIPLKTNETLTVVVFNLAESAMSSVNPTWSFVDGMINITDPQEAGKQILSQHTIIRGDFVRDDADQLPPSSLTWSKDLELNRYAPPSYFEYEYWPAKDGRKPHSVQKAFHKRYHTDHDDWYRLEDCSSSVSSTKRLTPDRFRAEELLYARNESRFAPINQLSLSQRLDDWARYNNLATMCEFRKAAGEKGNVSSVNEEDGDGIVQSGCTIRDSMEHDVYWSIGRIGPFRSRGGYTHKPYTGNVLSLPEWASDRDLFVLGGAIHPVEGRRFETLQYPPIRIDHADVSPYDAQTCGEERHVGNGPHSGTSVHHCAILQAMGDTSCTNEEGGVSCLLKTLPAGYGYRLSNFTGSFHVDLDTNDVRKRYSPEIEYYVQLAVKWTLRETVIPTTNLGFQNPISVWDDGGVPDTYKFYREDAAIVWFNYTNKYMGNGRLLLDSLALHTHQTMFDSLWLFKGDNIYSALENYRVDVVGQGKIPAIVAAEDEELLQNKSAMFSFLKANVKFEEGRNELVCEVPSPNLKCKRNAINSFKLDVDDTDDVEELKEIPWMLYDRRTQLFCKDGEDVRLAVNDTLTVVVFNLADSYQMSIDSSWDNSGWAMKLDRMDFGNPQQQILAQQVLFRGDFVRDDANTLERSSLDWKVDLALDKFAPPAAFGHQSWPDGLVKHVFHEHGD